MKKIISYSWICLALFILQGCACRFSYEFDGGRNYKESNLKYRNSAVPVHTIGLELDVLSDYSGIEVNKAYYSPLACVDSLKAKQKVVVINKTLSFPDGTILEQKSRPMGINAKCFDNDGKEIPCLNYYYTCDNFKKKFRKYKQLNLKVVYDLDSLGVITHYEKEYELVRKKHCRVAVH